LDTKLRSLSRNSFIKSIAFILVIVMISSIAGIIIYGYYSGINPEVIFTKNYVNSETYTRDFRDIVQSLDMALSGSDGTIPDGISYYGTRSGQVIASSLSISESEIARIYQLYYHLDNGVLTKYENGNQEEMLTNFSPSGSSIFFVIHSSFYEEQQYLWESGRNQLMPLVITSLAFIVSSIALITYLFMVTGRKIGDNGLHLGVVDRLYTEVILVLIAGALGLWVAVVFTGTGYGSPNKWIGEVVIHSREMMEIYIVTGITAFTTFFVGLGLLSLARRIKGKVLLKSSFGYKVFYRGFVLIKSLIIGENLKGNPPTHTLHKRQVNFVLVSFGLVFLTMILMFTAYPLAFIPPAIEIFVIYLYFKSNKETYEEINKGYSESLQEQLKAERMKINLVTNVSHDLKTPLTSIISYVDLLSREEDLSDTARDYVKIISDKASRLKNIVADLFDLAKSTSGDINLDLERLDLKKLVQQTIVDMDDSIKDSGFIVKEFYPEESVDIYSDGKKLYRVIQNLVDNALKYSLEGSRIYVEVNKDDDWGMFCIKNTANYEMEFTKEEILQRFFRGDQARSSEGSGLGLSIAESFTEVTGGSFDIEVDGDQFKAIVKFRTEN